MDDVMPISTLAALEHIGLVSHGRRVLDDVELAVAAGETVVVQGDNGAGKSLLLRVIAGLARASEGRVRLFGSDMSGAGPASWAAARRRMGIAFQNGGLLNELTVAENIAYPLLMAENRPSPRAVASKLEHALISAGLYRVADALPWQLSSGQVRLTALARATVAEPELVLLDDLFAGLDDDAALEMEQRFLASRNPTAGVLLLTSEAALAERCADRRLRLELGVLRGP